MRTTLFLALGVSLVLFSNQSLALTATHSWSQRYGGTQNDGIGVLGTDPAGNIVVIGSYRDVINFGGGSLTSSGALDIFLTKLTPTGAHIWSKSFGQGFDNDSGNAAACDASGNVYITGSVGTQPVDFGGGALAPISGSSDGYLAKYDTFGNHLWSQRLGGNMPDTGISLTVDPSGNVLLTGLFQGTANFGGGALVSAGFSDIFVAKYNAAGTHQWSKRFGSTGFDQGNSVKLDGSGNVYLIGQYQGSVDFGGGLASAGGYDIYLVKMNSSGTHLWSQRFGSTSDDIAYRVAVEPDGTCYIAGSFTGTVNFGGGALVSAGSTDIIVARYDAAGLHQWSQRYGSTTQDIGTLVALDGAGNLYLTGIFSGTVNLGGGPVASNGSDDGFLLKLTTGGAYQWDRRAGGASNNDAYGALAADAAGNVITTGTFTGSADFGGGTLFSSAASVDVFLAGYATAAAISSIEDIGNDQGRRAKIRFSRASQDQAGYQTIVKYEAFRRDDAPPLLMTEQMSRAQLLDNGWTFAGEVPAHQKETYGIDVATIADSTLALGQYYSVFFIRAATASQGVFFDSPIDSGYSKDNLAPAVPSSFAFASGQLTWDESSAEDFDYFSVYGSNTNTFASATLVDYTVAAAMDVNASPFVYYFVTATDFSGNEGKPAVVNTLSGVGGTPNQYSLSLSAYPNPFNPRTTIRYTLPGSGHVAISIYDARGVRVSVLVNEEKPAGAYMAAWNGRSETGAIASSGVYFARIGFRDETRAYKLLLLK